MPRSCGTQPMPAAARISGARRVISRPDKRTVPWCRVVRPTSVLIKVVLPVPLRPRSASASPSCNEKLMLWMAIAAP